MDYLLFRLYGSMTSWGEIAVGATRHTANYPSKSALVGLMAAALGIKRSDVAAQQQMQQGYAIAVEVFAQGALLRDYHTTQVPDSVGKVRYATRRDELLRGKAWLGTILSSREYRSDALALVAVKALADAPYDLQTIQQHLNKPKFHLYLGRKSCPLAAPLYPKIHSSADYFSAFKGYDHKPLLSSQVDDGCQLSKRDDYWLQLGKQRHYYWEGEIADFSSEIDMAHVQTRTRHDQPLSRTRWQFSPRQEHNYMAESE